MENLFIEHFLSYEDFRSNKEIQALELNEEDLKAIYQVIDQNRFLLCSEHYLPILFQSIMKKTSVATSLKLKSLFQNHHSIFLNSLVISQNDASEFQKKLENIINDKSIKVFSIYGVSKILGTSFILSL